MTGVEFGLQPVPFLNRTQLWAVGDPQQLAALGLVKFNERGRPLPAKLSNGRISRRDDGTVMVVIPDFGRFSRRNPTFLGVLDRMIDSQAGADFSLPRAPIEE